MDNKLGKPFKRVEVDDIKAVLRRYGISRFTYHTWSMGPQQKNADFPDAYGPEGRSRGRLTKGRFFTAKGRGIGGEGKTSLEGYGNPGHESEGIVTHKKERGLSDAGSESGLGMTLWDEPDDLRGERLPIFEGMRVSEDLVEALAKQRRPTVDAHRGDGGALADFREMNPVAPEAGLTLPGAPGRLGDTPRSRDEDDSVPGALGIEEDGVVQRFFQEGVSSASESTGQKKREHHRVERQAKPENTTARMQLRRFVLKGVEDE